MTEPLNLNNIDNKGYEEAYLADAIRFQMKRDNKRFWAGDNISDYLYEGDKEKSKMSFKDLGVRLESSEISKYSKMYDNLTVKFSDDEATYNLFIAIDIKDALPKDATKDFSHKDIEKCYIKFKKYNLDTFEVVGQITKNVEIDKIDEEFLIDLKIEMDDEFGDQEEFEIETK